MDRYTGSSSTCRTGPGRSSPGRVAAGEPEDKFRLEVDPGLPETWLDADKIDQILGNLVENAVRHGAGIVTVVAQRAYTGSDQREAMPCQCAIRARAFRPRWRTACSGSSGGASAAAAPVLASTSSRASSSRSAVTSPWRARRVAAPSSDLSCPRARPSSSGSIPQGRQRAAAGLPSRNAGEQVPWLREAVAGVYHDVAGRPAGTVRCAGLSRLGPFLMIAREPSRTRYPRGPSSLWLNL